MPGRRRHAAWRPDAVEAIEALQVVYKVAERCNIDCTYCYYFNMGEETALSRPARAPLEVSEVLAAWIAQGCEELRIPLAKVSFHGGEPTLVGVKEFDRACRALRELVEPVARLSLSIQTNGMLIDDGWIDVFADHNVGVGVSIDGPREANDRFRLDRRGESSFDQTEKGIRRLVAAYDRGGPLPSTISVLHHENDYRAIYRYLRGLGVREMNFLLPDRNADDLAFVASGEAAGYGTCMLDILAAWLEEDDPDVHVKFVDQLLVHFRADARPGQVFRRDRKSNQVVIVRSDATVAIDDTFIPALNWYANAPVHSMRTSTLREVLADPVFREIEETANALPSGCGECRWRNACRGGDFENRFSQANGFDNPSVYCESYKILYEGVCAMLVGNGFPPSLVTEKFGLV